MAHESDPAAPRLAGFPRDNLVIAGVLVAFGVGVYLFTLTFERVPVTLSLNMGPRYFPQLLVWTLFGLTAAMLLEARGRPGKRRGPIPRIVLISAIALVVTVLVIRYLGLLVTLYLCSLLFPLLWGERRYGAVLAFAALFPTALYLLFAKVLEVQFPRGLLLNWLGL